MAEQGKQQRQARIERIHSQKVKLDNAASLPPGTWPYEPDENARVMATRANIRPNF